MAVQLGVAVRAASLQTQQFPLGKVAGAPLWLLPESRPEVCSTCSGNLTFLLQVYSPLELPQTFHRYIYVLWCQRCKKCSIFRCQLPQENSLYPAVAPSGELEEEKEMSDEQLLAMLEAPVPATPTPLPMTDLTLDIVEEAAEITAAARELYTLDLCDSQAVEDFSERLPCETSKKAAIAASDYPDEEMDQLDSIIKQHHRVEIDAAFELFRLASRFERKQCIRFNRGGVPLWYSDKARPVLRPSACEACGCRRVFEFQVMPQTIDIGRLEEVEFGAIYVFTCENSCQGGENYMAEVAFVHESL